MTLTDTATTAGGYTDVQPGDTVSRTHGVTTVTLGDGPSGDQPAPAATSASAAPSAQPSASQIVSDTLAAMGLGGYGGALADWVTSSISTLTGQGMSQSSIETWIEQNINKPIDPNTGQTNAAAQSAFDQLLPGYNQRIQETGNNGAPGGGPGAGIAAYISYQNQLKSIAQTAGLPPDFIDSQTIGNLWAGDVSTAEVTSRVNEAYALGYQAAPQVAAEMANYGFTTAATPGQLAAYYLDPEKTTGLLQQQYNEALTGGTGVTSGFGEIGQAQAQSVAAFLSNNNTNQVTTQQAAGFYSSNLGGGLSSIAGMAHAGFENASLGQAQGGPGVVTQAQLLAAAEGNGGALSDVRRAAETRSAASQGGGGFASNQQGITGVGYGSQ